MNEDLADDMGNARTDGASLRRADAEQARVNRLERFRSNGDSSLMGTVALKTCYVCGCDLAHKIRFKDANGRYWCSRCNEIDHARTRPAPCADCGVEMPRDQMSEMRGMILCPVCFENRQKAGATLQMRHATPAQRPPTAQSSLPVLPLVFATIGVVMAIIAIALTLR